MSVELSSDEKISIINQHIRNLQFGKFNLEVTLVEENARLSPDAQQIESLNDQISDMSSRISALSLEIQKLSN